jgi:hypothetical protein
MLDFWEAALDLNLEGKQYEGFGDFAVVDGIDDDRWLDLALRTAQICTEGLEMPNRVAERAAMHPDDPRSLQIVAALLSSHIEVWFVSDIGEIGLELLNASNTTDKEVYGALREQLIEREFFSLRNRSEAVTSD